MPASSLSAWLHPEHSIAVAPRRPREVHWPHEMPTMIRFRLRTLLIVLAILRRCLRGFGRIPNGKNTEVPKRTWRCEGPNWKVQRRFPLACGEARPHCVMPSCDSNGTMHMPGRLRFCTAFSRHLETTNRAAGRNGTLAQAIHHPRLALVDGGGGARGGVGIGPPAASTKIEKIRKQLNWLPPSGSVRAGFQLDAF